MRGCFVCGLKQLFGPGACMLDCAYACLHSVCTALPNRCSYLALSKVHHKLEQSLPVFLVGMVVVQLQHCLQQCTSR